MGNKGKGYTKTELFESMSVPKAIMTLAVPTIISQLITLVYNLTDTFFVGRTGDPYKIAGVSLAYTLFVMTVGLANLFGIGGGSKLARMMGEGKTDKCKAVSIVSVASGFVLALIYSILVLVFLEPLLRLLGASDATLPYAKTYTVYVIILGTIPTVLSQTMAHLVRNVGYSSQASLGLSGGGILNIILDYLLMFKILPPGNEVLGAALATLISNVAAMIYFIILYIRYSKTTVLSLNLKNINDITKEDYRDIISVGVPSAILTILYDVANIVLNALMATHGDIQLAAMGIVLKAERLPNAIGIGLSQGMLPLVAYNYSSGNHSRMNEVIKTSCVIGLSCTFVTLILYELFARQIGMAFVSTSSGDREIAEATIDYIEIFIRIRAVGTILQFLNYHSSFCMQGMGYGKGTLIHAFFRDIVFYIPAMFIMNALFGEIGLACAVLVGEGLGGIMAIWLRKRYVAGTQPA